MLNEVLLLACKELIDDAKLGCADLVFKFYAAERMKERMVRNPGKKVKIQ